MIMTGGGQLTVQNIVQKHLLAIFLTPFSSMTYIEFTKITSHGRWHCAEKNQLLWNFQQDNQESPGLICLSRELGVPMSLNAHRICLLLPVTTEYRMQLMLTPQVSGPASSWPSAHRGCLYESLARFGEAQTLETPRFTAKISI